MQICAGPAGSTLAPSYHYLGLWRTSQPSQCTLVERRVRIVSWPCNGRLSSHAGPPPFPFHGFCLVDAIFHMRRQTQPSQKARTLQFLSSRRERQKFLSCATGVSNEAATLATAKEQFVSLAEIKNAACRQGLELITETVGPFFRVRVLTLLSKEVLGVAQGVVKVWTSGRILHLDYIRLNRLSLQAEKPILGIGFLLGAAAIRHGYDQKCKKAELLAIKDTDVYHLKLVRYYSRMGFRSVYEVTGNSLQDIPHRLIWGGVGTRMDASIEELLRKWSPVFRRLSK